LAKVFYAQSFDFKAGDSKHISINFNEFVDKIAKVRDQYIMVIEVMSTVKSLGEKNIHNALTV